MKIIHITDTHLLKSGELFHGFDTQQRFALCMRNVRENHSDAHCIVVTGDVAERGDPEAYLFFNDQIAAAGLPVYSILGNHDDRKNYHSQFPAKSPESDGFAQAAIETPVGVFLLLDTKLDDSDAGTFCKRRQRWLLEQLKKFHSVPVFLFMHHPPFDLNLPGIDKIGLDAKEAFASVVNTHTNVRHLFFGHAHRPLSGNWKGISFSSMSGTNHQASLDFHGVGTQPVADNPEYAIVFIDDDQLVVHTHSYMNDYC
ncbi:phosphodiesterase [Granulosicoccus sp.]|nr:phosphodiesterase [Granulosicoccus sp.]MDB4224499.1 phosphodiesterase [Granulosicoccus sp.]